jgi:hypothetical protein
MTYQLSYCVFTAATFEADLMKQSKGAIAAEAARRLSAAMRILFHEAKHTPGISGSLDTIRRQLATRKPMRRSTEQQGRKSQATNADRSQRAADHSHSSYLGDPESAQTCDITTSGEDILNAANSTNTFQHGESIVPGHVPSSLLGGYDARSDAAFGIAGIDTGAGFHPDAFPWSFTDLSQVDNVLEPHWAQMQTLY